MSNMLFKIRRPKAKLVDKHQPRGHIRRIINGQKEKLKKMESVNHTNDLSKELKIIVQNFAHTLKGVIKEGSVVIGCVQDIQANTMVLSIPGCLGILNVAHVSDGYTEQMKLFINTTESALDLPTLKEMFELGDVLACAVVEKNTDPESRLCDWVLSISPKKVNLNIGRWNIQKKMILNCSVKSVEDHGYMMDTGSSGVVGFMPFANAESFLKTRTCSKRERLSIGQVLPCAVSIPEGHESETLTSSVILTADPNLVAHSHIKRSCFNADKLHLIPPGNRLQGVVEQVRSHGIVLRLKDCKVFVPRLHLENRWKSPKDYSVGTMVHGKLLTYHKESETLLVTLRESLVQNTKITTLPQMNCGAILDTAEVACIESNLTYFKINSDFRGIATKQLMKGFDAELKMNCRCQVISMNSLDDTITVSIKKDEIKENYLSVEEPKCGDIVKGTPGNRNQNGHLCLQICRKVYGVIKQVHLSNWQPGLEIIARVIGVNPQMGLVELDSHPDFVYSELPIIDRYDCAVPGLTTHGIVVDINEFTASVKFYNGVEAKVEFSSKISWAKRPSFYLERGSVVKCVVVDCKPDEQLLKIEIQDLKDYTGEFYSCTVVHVADSGLKVELSGSAMKQYWNISKYRLSDNYKFSELLLKTFDIGDALKNLLSVERGHLLRNKLFIHWEKTHKINSEQDIKVGDIFPCSILQSGKQEICASLPGGFAAYSDDSVDLDQSIMEIGTRFIKISRIERSVKIFFTFLSSIEASAQMRIKFLKFHLNDLFRLQKVMFQGMHVGEIVQFMVSAKKSNCIHGTVHEEEAIAFEEHSKELASKSLEAVIVYLDPVCNLIEVSCRKDFIELLSPRKTGKLPKLKEQYACTCVLVKPEFALAALNGEFKRKLVYLPGTEYANTKIIDALSWDIGTQLMVSIRIVKKTYSIGLVVWKVPVLENVKRKCSLAEKDSKKISVKKLKKETGSAFVV